jgi:sortase A
LKKGDEIFIDFDGILYRYQVINMEEVSPDNVRVLEQRYDSEYLSLITCVPPGTYLRRLVITTKLMKF